MSGIEGDLERKAEQAAEEKFGSLGIDVVKVTATRGATHQIAPLRPERQGRRCAAR